MERSSVIFHGSGDSAVPAAPPMTNDRKLRRSIFIYPFPSRINKWVCSSRTVSPSSFVTDETAVLLGLHAAGGHVGLLVALGTVVHFHAVPGVALEAGDVLAPDVPAVSRDPVLLIGLEALGLADGAMAGDALHFARLHMGGMREEDAV